MYNIYIICISLRMRVHVCVRHLPTDCDRINRYLSSKITLHVSPPKTSNSPPSFVSFNGFNSPFGFFHQPNDARKRANYWPRDTCAISYGATFLPNVPSYPPPILGKENCPKIADRRAIAAMGKPSSFFLFFFYFDPREKKKKRMHERDFSILSIGNRTKENSKAISNVSGEKVRSVGRAVTDFICSTLDGYESCTGIQVSIVYTSLTPRTRNRPPRYYNPDILSRYSVASMFVSKTRYVDYI